MVLHHLIEDRPIFPRKLQQPCKMEGNPWVLGLFWVGGGSFVNEEKEKWKWIEEEDRRSTIWCHEQGCSINHEQVTTKVHMTIDETQALGEPRKKMNSLLYIWIFWKMIKKFLQSLWRKTYIGVQEAYFTRMTQEASWTSLTNFLTI